MNLFGFTVTRTPVPIAEPEPVAEPLAAPAAPTPAAKPGWDRDATINDIFDAIELRVGKVMCDDLRDDFAKHVAEDPVGGWEQGATCLITRLVIAVDTVAGSPTTQPKLDEAPPPVNFFTMFRKIE